MFDSLAIKTKSQDQNKYPIGTVLTASAPIDVRVTYLPVPTTKRVMAIGQSVMGLRSLSGKTSMIFLRVALVTGSLNAKSTICGVSIGFRPPGMADWSQ